mmetsp:Transcript_41687/g.78014  ORF Transcript_41687/g.78014 Transcript_41687/m.78014 type:complete len:240 (+) Transcript_41687:1396-2115(+)
MSVQGQKAPPTTNVCAPALATSMRLFIHGSVLVGSGSNEPFTSPYRASAAATSSFAASSSACLAARSSSSMSLGSSACSATIRSSFLCKRLSSIMADESTTRCGTSSNSICLDGPSGSLGSSSGGASSSSSSSLLLSTMGYSGSTFFASFFLAASAIFWSSTSAACTPVSSSLSSSPWFCACSAANCASQSGIPAEKLDTLAKPFFTPSLASKVAGMNFTPPPTLHMMRDRAKQEQNER